MMINLCTHVLQIVSVAETRFVILAKAGIEFFSPGPLLAQG